MKNKLLIPFIALLLVVLYSCNDTDNNNFVDSNQTVAKKIEWLDFSNRDTLRADDVRRTMYRVTILESFIIYHDIMRKYCSELDFEYQIYGLCQNFITNSYTSPLLPYDSTWSEGYDTLSVCALGWKERYKDIDLVEYDKQKRASLLNDSTMTQMKRIDFWNTIFAIHREVANPDAFAMVEDAIREAHDHWGLNWNDSIFIRKTVFDSHRWMINDIFTNMKEEINPVFLR